MASKDAHISMRVPAALLARVEQVQDMLARDPELVWVFGSGSSRSAALCYVLQVGVAVLEEKYSVPEEEE